MRWMTAFRDGLRQFRAQRERGATSVVAGLLMVGLVGFTGLAVDGGGTYAKYQELQNGADAAALAAAQECAADESECTEGNLEDVAGPYGEDNVRNDKDTVETSFNPDLVGREVTATVAGSKFHWFLPVVGISESGLSADATATWGSPISGPAMLPLAFSQCEFADALGDPILGTILDIYMPKNGQDAECGWGPDYPPGGFGWLDTGPDGCSTPVTVDEWAAGETGTADKTGCDWPSFIGQVVLVPIFDDYSGNGADGEFHIERFAAMEILGIRPSNSNAPKDTYGDTCPNAPPDPVRYHSICVRGIFIEYVSTAEGYVLDPYEDTEVAVVRLID